MNCFSEEQLNRISHLVREIEKLSDVEKLFLYLQLPCGRAEGYETGIEGKSSSKFNAGSKPNLDLFAKKSDQETTQTYTWILSHLEVDPNVSLPKQEVYDEYRAFCQANRFEPLCVADFGKAMKHAFPCIKPRRLGQRGNSRYCYSGLRKKYKIQPPNLPDLIEPTFCMDNDCSQAVNQIIKDCRDNPEECPLDKPIFTVNEVMNLKIEHNNHHQYPSNSRNINGSQSSNTGCASSSTNFNVGDNSAKQHSNNIQHQHHQHQHHHNNSSNQTQATPDIGSRQRLPNAQANITNIQLTPVTGVAHDYIPSNPIPISQTSHQSSLRYSYSEMIQQPGTPDDDDYQHNYHQDNLPINRHLFSSALNVPSHQQPPPPPLQQQQQQQHHHHTQHQASAPTGEGSSQLHQHHNHQHHHLQHLSMKLSSDGSGRFMDTNNQEANDGHNHPDGSTNNQQMLQPQSSFANDPLVSGNAPPPPPPPQPSTASAGFNGCPEMLQFSHMNNSLIDSCASPFLSPASTPYHQMGNYMSPDIQDYYSTNDCIRYTS